MHKSMEPYRPECCSNFSQRNASRSNRTLRRQSQFPSTKRTARMQATKLDRRPTTRALGTLLQIEGSRNAPRRTPKQVTAIPFYGLGGSRIAHPVGPKQVTVDLFRTPCRTLAQSDSKKVQVVRTQSLDKLARDLQWPAKPKPAKTRPIRLKQSGEPLHEIHSIKPLQSRDYSVSAD